MKEQNEKQAIEGMAELLWHFPNALHLNCYNDCEEAAKLLYEEGYSKQRVGVWIRHKENCLYNKCSICSYEHCREDNYCPNCGARMKGGEE